MDEEILPKKILNWIPTADQKQDGKEYLRAMEEDGLRDGDWEDRLHWRLGCKRSCHVS
jgi:hypothetical protein